MKRFAYLILVSVVFEIQCPKVRKFNEKTRSLLSDLGKERYSRINLQQNEIQGTHDVFQPYQVPSKVQPSGSTQFYGTSHIGSWPQLVDSYSMNPSETSSFNSVGLPDTSATVYLSQNPTFTVDKPPHISHIYTDSSTGKNTAHASHYIDLNPSTAFVQQNQAPFERSFADQHGGLYRSPAYTMPNAGMAFIAPSSQSSYPHAQKINYFGSNPYSQGQAMASIPKTSEFMSGNPWALSDDQLQETASSDYWQGYWNKIIQNLPTIDFPDIIDEYPTLPPKDILSIPGASSQESLQQSLSTTKWQSPSFPSIPTTSTEPLYQGQLDVQILTENDIERMSYEQLLEYLANHEQDSVFYDPLSAQQLNYKKIFDKFCQVSYEKIIYMLENYINFKSGVEKTNTPENRILFSSMSYISRRQISRLKPLCLNFFKNDEKKCAIYMKFFTGLNFNQTDKINDKFEEIQNTYGDLRSLKVHDLVRLSGIEK